MRFPLRRTATALLMLGSGLLSAVAGSQVAAQARVAAQPQSRVAAESQMAAQPQVAARFQVAVQSQVAAPFQDLQASLQAVLDAFHAGGTFPGASAAVSLPDGTVIPLTVGEADTVGHIPMDPSHRMLQGSVGKTYFAALAIQLIGEKRLDLDAKVSSYLGHQPWYGRIPNADGITVKQLMTHTSGVMRYEFKEAFTLDLSAQPDKQWRPEELLAYVLDEEASFVQGEGWEYSDTNFILLGMIMEEVTGEACYDLIQERILDPLSLGNTVPSSSRTIPGLIQGYAGPANPFGGRDEVILPDGRFVINPQFEWAGGGFASTAEDLARWARALYTGRAFDPALLPLMLDGGFFPGYLTEMAYFPDLDVAVALQVNTSVGRALGRSPVSVLVELAQVVGR